MRLSHVTTYARRIIVKKLLEIVTCSRTSRLHYQKSTPVSTKLRLPFKRRTYSDVPAPHRVVFCTSTKRDEEQDKHVWKVVEPLVTEGVNSPAGKLWTEAWAPFELFEQ